MQARRQTTLVEVEWSELCGRPVPAKQGMSAVANACGDRLHKMCPVLVVGVVRQEVLALAVFACRPCIVLQVKYVVEC